MAESMFKLDSEKTILQRQCLRCQQELQKDAVTVQLSVCSHEFRLCTSCAIWRELSWQGCDSRSDDHANDIDGTGPAVPWPSQCPECGNQLQDGDFTLLSSPSDYEIQIDVDCYILPGQNYCQIEYSEDHGHHLGNTEEWIQLQTSLLPPEIQLFSSTVSPCDSPPQSLPSPTSIQQLSDIPCSQPP